MKIKTYFGGADLGVLSHSIRIRFVLASATSLSNLALKIHQPFA